MRIAIDGFNLGLLQGTGLSTYARELSHVLQCAGHEVFPIYALEHSGSDPLLSWPTFLQTLNARGEAARTDYRRWLPTALRYLPHTILPTKGFRLNKISTGEAIDTQALKDQLPTFTGIYNYPGIFRAAQMYASVFQKNLRIHAPDLIDALHLTCPIPVQMPGVKTIVTVHDIIPLVLPHSTQTNLSHYKRLIQTALKQADMLFCISETSRQDIIRWFNIPASRTHLTYQAVNIPADFISLPDTTITSFLKNNYGLDKDGYFLYFGTVEPKKNVARIIDAMSMATTERPLVIAGKLGWQFDDVTKRLHNAPKGRIHYLDYVPFKHLMYLVKGARGLIFPSLYEGFGLPVLEAMQLGCPVITSNTTSLKEVAGDAALTVNPYDVGAIQAAIEQLNSDEVLRQELIEKGYQQAERFSPSKHAERLAEGYAKIGLSWS